MQGFGTEIRVGYTQCGKNIFQSGNRYCMILKILIKKADCYCFPIEKYIEKWRYGRVCENLKHFSEISHKNNMIISKTSYPSFDQYILLTVSKV